MTPVEDNFGSSEELRAAMRQQAIIDSAARRRRKQAAIAEQVKQEQLRERERRCQQMRAQVLDCTVALDIDYSAFMDAARRIGFSTSGGFLNRDGKSTTVDELIESTLAELGIRAPAEA